MIFCEADRIESIRRMKEIDDMRARGLKTECEQIKVDISESREKPTRSTRVYVKNFITDEEKEHESIKQACKEYGLSYYQVYKQFKKSSSKKILHNRLLIKKIDEKRVIKWTDEELAFLVQSRPGMQWHDIALALDRTKGACFEKYKAIKDKGKLEYYLNFDYEDIS